MPMPTAIRDLLKELYDEAESAPDQQANRRVAFRGRTYKVRVELANPDRPAGTILIALTPRPE